MNPKHNQSSSFSQADADLLSRLTDLAETLEPHSTFQAELEAKLLQAPSANSTGNRSKGANRKIASFPWFNRRASKVAWSFIAITIALIIPTLKSGQATGWLSTMLNSTLNSKANAQTIAQAVATGQITLTSDVQEQDKTTQNVRAIGNASFVYPEAQIRASASEIRYMPTAEKVSLLGNVQISQRGENLQGKQAICSLKQKQCNLTQK